MLASGSNMNSKQTAMKKVLLIIVSILCLGQGAGAQDEEKGWGIKFSGFVKTDIFYDTRQSTASNGLREGHFYLFPDNVLYDEDMNDLNANPSFHILNIQTRVRGDISGPDAFGAKTSGAIEAEFFGTGESDINGFRLRHSYVKMDWPKVALLAGQYWHPMFPAENFPGTVSFNTGAPFVPFSRNPQVRVVYNPGKLMSITLAAYSQRDFTSPGPEGGSSRYIRNSGRPGLHLQFRVPAGEYLTAWGGVDYKVLRPEIRTPANTETTATVGSLSAFASLKLKTGPVNFSVMGVYAENAADLMMIGGYAPAGYIDPIDQAREWTTLNTASFWADISTTVRKTSLGLFSGYSKNLGSRLPVEGDFYGRGGNIDHLFRLSPRLTVTEGKLSIAAELESTLAAYGTVQPDGRVTDTGNVTNVRLLLSFIYRF
jgi:hypothetical protein